MLKKARAELGSQHTEKAKGLAQAVLDSSHQIWLAGLGAFAKAQQGGTKVFQGLVKQGESLEAKTRDVAAQTAKAARGAAEAKAKEMQAMAGGTWDKLEQVFENRVARALGRLGVYSASDVKRLTDRVDELSEAVNALLKVQGIKRRPRVSPVKKRVKGPARGTTRAAAGTMSTATNAAAEGVSKARKTAPKTLRAATRAAKATPK